jgi:FixJ family two-component response regulator
VSGQRETIFVVDDDQAARESLCWLIESVGLRVRCFASAREFLEGHDRSAQGCLLVDVRMPGMSGLELQERLLAEGSQLPVIVLTGHGDVPMAVRAMKAGAVDFVQKPFNDQALLDGIRRALEAGAAARQAAQRRQEASQRLASLSAREAEVLRELLAGKPNKVIAASLGIAEKTVEIHRANLMRKTGVRSVAELVRLTLQALPAHEPP